MSRAEGTWGEAEVAIYLRRRGYTLLAHGITCDPKKAGAAAENGGLVPDGEGPGLPRPLRRGGGVR